PKFAPTTSTSADAAAVGFVDPSHSPTATTVETRAIGRRPAIVNRPASAARFASWVGAVRVPIVCMSVSPCKIWTSDRTDGGGLQGQGRQCAPRPWIAPYRGDCPRPLAPLFSDPAR